MESMRACTSSDINDCLTADEDGLEFEKELTEAMEGLSVSATADKLSKVMNRRYFCSLDQILVES